MLFYLGKTLLFFKLLYAFYILFPFYFSQSAITFYNLLKTKNRKNINN